MAINNLSKSTFLKTMLLTAVLAVPTLSYAMPPSDAQLERFIAISQINEQFSDGFKMGMLQVVKDRVISHPKWQTLSKDQQAQVEQALENYVNQVANELDTPELRQAVLAQFKAVAWTHYNADEVAAMNAFYSTPIGQSVATKQTNIMNDFTQSVGDYIRTPAVIQKLENVSQKHAKTLENQLKNIGLD